MEYSPLYEQPKKSYMVERSKQGRELEHKLLATHNAVETQPLGLKPSYVSNNRSHTWTERSKHVVELRHKLLATHKTVDH